MSPFCSSWSATTSRLSPSFEAVELFERLTASGSEAVLSAGLSEDLLSMDLAISLWGGDGWSPCCCLCEAYAFGTLSSAIAQITSARVSISRRKRISRKVLQCAGGRAKTHASMHNQRRARIGCKHKIRLNLKRRTG